MPITYTVHFQYTKEGYGDKAPDYPWAAQRRQDFHDIDYRFHLSDVHRQAIKSPDGIVYFNGVDSISHGGNIPSVLFEREPKQLIYYPVTTTNTQGIYSNVYLGNTIYLCQSIFPFNFTAGNMNIYFICDNVDDYVARILCYENDSSTDRPGALIDVSGELNLENDGFIGYSLTMPSLNAGDKIWFGVWLGQDTSLRAASGLCCRQLCGVSGTGDTIGTMLIKSYSYSSTGSPPATWNFDINEVYRNSVDDAIIFFYKL